MNENNGRLIEREQLSEMIESFNIAKRTKNS